MQSIHPILVIAEDRDQVGLIQEILRNSGPGNTLVHMSDTEAALSYLRQTDGLPCLILMDGFGEDRHDLDFLETIKHDMDLQLIPVVALAVNHRHDLIEDGFLLGMAGCLVKSEDREHMKIQIQAIVDYWSLHRLPA